MPTSIADSMQKATVVQNSATKCRNTCCKQQTATASRHSTARRRPRDMRHRAGFGTQHCAGGGGAGGGAHGPAETISGSSG